MRLLNRYLAGGVGLLALAAVLAPTDAEAVARLSFDDEGAVQNGTVAFAGGNAPMVGTDIVIAGVLGTGTPANPGTDLTCACSLNFETGDFDAFTSTITGATTRSSYTFNGGGTFDITGTVSNSTRNIATGTLLDGTFTFAEVDITERSGVANRSITINGDGVDAKDPDLLKFFGLPQTGFIFVQTEIVGDVLALDPNGGAFDFNVAEVDVTNEERVVEAPEPASLGLLGAGLLGVGFVLRRRRA